MGMSSRASTTKVQRRAVSDIDLVVLAAEAGRQLSAVFPDWGVARAALAALPWLESCQRYGELASAHDYWWPLVRGAEAHEDCLVIDDTRGVTSARLALFASSVTAVFDNADDARSLQESQHLR